MTIEEINHEIELLEPAEVNTRNVQVLSSLYVIRDNMSSPHISDVMPDMRLNTDFSNAVSGMNVKDVMIVVNELMDTLRVMYPKLYDSVMRRFT